MYTIGNQMKEHWNENYCITYTNGMNAEQLGAAFQLFLTLGQWIGIPIVILEIDQHRFDGHQGEGSHAYETNEINKYKFVQSKNYKARLFRKCLKSQAATAGATRDGHRFSYKYKRHSGDSNTSSGNTEKAVGSINYALEKCGLRLGTTRAQCRVMALGDDAIVRLPHGTSVEDAQGLVENLVYHCDVLGFKTKMSVKTSTDVSFCSGRFYPVTTENDGDYVWGPKLGRVLFKYYWKKDEDGCDRDWLNGIVTSRRLDFAFLPILRVINSHLYDLGFNQQRYVKIDFKPHATVAHQMNERTWFALFCIYGVTQAEFLAAEDSIRDQLGTDSSGLLVHPVLDRLVFVDVGVPVDRFDL
jgi:hypothetical protein